MNNVRRIAEGYREKDESCENGVFLENEMKKLSELTAAGFFTKEIPRDFSMEKKYKKKKKEKGKTLM